MKKKIKKGHREKELEKKEILNRNESLEEEMKAWQEASEEDTYNFNKKYNL